MTEGESTENWAIRSFLGTVKQLLNCARCGEVLRGGRDTPRHFRDVFKPSLHVLCDDCFEELPE